MLRSVDNANQSDTGRGRLKGLTESLKQKWYVWLVAFLFGLQVLVILIFRENSYIQIHDNLDLFMAHYQMIKLNHAFFAHNVTMPMLHGVDRDLLGSEFLLYNLLYIIFPNIIAYFIGYLLKIAIGFCGFILLAKEVYKERYESLRPIIIVLAAAYGMIPVFPTYGIAFTSVPIIVWLLIRLYRTEDIKKRLILYLGVFCYPLISYFSYHGFFILCYMVCAFIIVWVVKKRFPKTIITSICVLSVGYILWEYRLFSAMLFDDTVTIRTTMDHGHLTVGEALKAAAEEFFRTSFHSQDNHVYFVFWVCIIGIIIVNVLHIRKKEAKKIFTDPVNLIFAWMIFNCLIFGLYENEGFRTFVERLIPKLTGFEFARTAYFNTLLWFALLLELLRRLYETGKSNYRVVSGVIASIAVIIVMFVPAVYNDFYYTCYNQAYKIIKRSDTSYVNYREFYSTDLFEQIKEDIGYDGEWSAAYGLHPAVLQYNGIASVDGYLGMYPQTYKDKWRKVIEPALEGSPSLKDYYDGWGARVILYSGNDENTYAPLRVMELEDNRLMVNMDELKSLDCKYIFSRIDFTNADELGLKCIGTYSGCESPYTIFVFEID